jgi:uncharacterized protein YacL
MTTSENNPTGESINLNTVTRLHKRWLKEVFGLAALEAKISIVSSAQLLALMCGIVFLLVTAWLLILTAIGVVAWSYGAPLLSIIIGALLFTMISTFGLMLWVRNILKKMNFTRTLDAIIPDEDEDQ